MSGMSAVWEDTTVCAKQYRCAFSIYLMTVLSYSYGIIIDLALQKPCYNNKVVDGLNAPKKVI